MCSGVFSFEEVLRVPVAMAGDCAHLADKVTMGVLFSRGPAIDEGHVQHLCRVLTSEGGGTIGLSAILSPNTYLILGQGDTLKRFKATMHERLPKPAHLRINDYRWPPLHTPIVRQRHIPDRASVMMETMSGGFQPPTPPVLSLVTGKRSYDDLSARDLLRRWVDRPQRLWDAVYETLACGVTTVVHVGPAPNVIPATFRRLSENIKEQTANKSLGSLGLRAAVGLARRPWLSALLPARGALLRAPTVQHVILEDWPGSHSKCSAQLPLLASEKSRDSQVTAKGPSDCQVCTVTTEPRRLTQPTDRTTDRTRAQGLVIVSLWLLPEFERTT